MSDDVRKSESGTSAADKKETKIGLSRRDMFKVGAITTATLAAPVVLQNMGVRSMAASPKGEYAADILIIGSGFAGVFAAVSAAKAGLSVVMLDKGAVGWSGLSPWASDSRPFDPTIYDREEWRKNTSINTEWVNDQKWLDIFMDESLDIYDILREWGVHNCRPYERSKVFRAQLLEHNVQIVERTMVTSYLKDTQGRVAGALGFTFDDSAEPCKAVTVKAKAVINCMGAGAYKSPGFPNWGQTFDGDAISYDIGAYITGKEYHDTHGTFSNTPAASYNGWVWAQSVVGAYIMVGAPDPVEGGLNIRSALRVSQGGVDRRRGVGPGGEDPSLYKGEHPERVRNRRLYEGKGFLAKPGLILDWGGPPEGSDEDQGFDPGFRVGGSTAGMGVHKGEGVFNADHTCTADGVPGLFAAGDSLGSQLCGASYPARGFSSYGSAIQGRIAAASAVKYIADIKEIPELDQNFLAEKTAEMWAPREVKQGFSPEWITSTLQNTMTPYHVLYIKEENRLKGALASIEYMRKEMLPRMIAQDGHQLRMAHETKNMLLNAEMKLRAGIYRTESRGTHYREEYPARNDSEWHAWVLIKKGADGDMELSKYQLPKEWLPDADLSYREAYPRPYPGEDEFRARSA
ncbi:MAG: FAD-binding protein [Henriciella sp.]